MIEASRIGNPFAERHLLIGRLDHLSRNEDRYRPAGGPSCKQARRRRGPDHPLLRCAAAYGPRPGCRSGVATTSRSGSSGTTTPSTSTCRACGTRPCCSRPSRMVWPS
jgi:hypothetical protein